MILDDLVEATKKRLVAEKEKRSLAAVRKAATELATDDPEELYQVFSFTGVVNHCRSQKGFAIQGIDC